MVVLHMYATYQPHTSYCNENIQPDMSKSVILAFKMAAAILDSTDPIFVCKWAPWGYMLIPNLEALAYMVMKTSNEN